MAHECPDCGFQCHCNGDIDDLLLNYDDDINRCVHSMTPDCDAYESEECKEKESQP